MASVAGWGWLPAALAGIVWMLFITGTTLSVPALTGAIMCMGVATANSVLVIAFARERYEVLGDPVAAALEAGRLDFAEEFRLTPDAHAAPRILKNRVRNSLRADLKTGADADQVDAQLRRIACTVEPGMGGNLDTIADIDRRAGIGQNPEFRVAIRSERSLDQKRDVPVDDEDGVAAQADGFHIAIGVDGPTLLAGQFDRTVAYPAERKSGRRRQHRDIHRTGQRRTTSRDL